MLTLLVQKPGRNSALDTRLQACNVRGSLARSRWCSIREARQRAGTPKDGTRTATGGVHARPRFPTTSMWMSQAPIGAPRLSRRGTDGSHRRSDGSASN